MASIRSCYAIQVDFITGWYVQILRGVGDTEGLIPDCVSILQLRQWVLVPLLPVATEPDPQRVHGRRI